MRQARGAGSLIGRGEHSSLQARGLTVVVEPAQLEHITDAISWTDRTSNHQTLELRCTSPDDRA